jgi:hydrogenase expression/formation protein HypD
MILKKSAQKKVDFLVMKYIAEFRDSNHVKILVKQIEQTITRPWVVMEICGGQTHSIMRYGLDQLLPPDLELVHGPGCPVCVTSLELVDRALNIASRHNVIFTSYGDMLRVPGSNSDLFSIRAAGGDVRVVYSPLDAIKIAQLNPEKEIVFFAIGFETTAPANAMSIFQAHNLGLMNFSILASQVRVPPAMSLILASPGNRVQGFLAAGHVCTVMGYWEYPSISSKYKIPIVITGFEPVDILHGLLKVLIQLEEGRSEVENAYQRLVSFEGNRSAQDIIDEIFESCDQTWRGIGTITDSGWRIRDKYSFFDATQRFQVMDIHTSESPLCIAGEILQGRQKPFACSQFGVTCTPENPLGATMVSSEGACAAYYRYRNQS